MRARFLTVAMVAAAALLVGCDGGTITGTAKPTTKTEQSALFNPCTSIPADALTRTGVDPSTARPDVAGVKQEGWKICSWDGPWYYLKIFSTNYTLADVKNNPDFGDFKPIQIGLRNGLMYLDKSYAPGEMCDIAFGIDQGALLISVDKKGSKTQLDDPCAVVTRHATDLEPMLPK